MPRSKKNYTDLLFAEIGRQNDRVTRRQKDHQSIARDSFTQLIVDGQKAAIDRWYTTGGRMFLEWARSNYRIKTGEVLSWNEPFLESFYIAMGNPWFERVIVEKGAQMGFTEYLICSMAFALAELHIPSALGFEAEGKLRDVVSPRIQPSFDLIKQIRDIRAARFKATGRKDTDFQQRKITVGGVELTLFYTSTVSAKRNQESSAPSSLRSFTGWFVGGDEIELWHPSALDIVVERQGACPMATKPLRIGSTPGMVGGVVDTQVKLSKYVFEWFIECPTCGDHQPLDAYGNLIKAVLIDDEQGDTQSVFLNEVGRPLDWHCHDRTSRETMIQTSYIGCRSCDEEFSRATLNKGSFRDIKGIDMLELCDRTVSERSSIFEAVAIRLPRLASILFRPAERIRKLLVTLNPADQIQQGLGKAVSIGNGKIDLSRLIKCCGRDLSQVIGDRAPDLIVIGMDQGRAANWVQVQQWYMGEGETWEEQWITAIKVVVFYGSVHGFNGLADLADYWNADLIGFDGEPEVQLAADFARMRSPDEVDKGRAYMFDQVRLKGENFRQSEREVQNCKYQIYAVHRTFGLDAVRNRLYADRQFFTGELQYNPGDDQNLFYHYLTSDRRSTGLWVTESDNAPDHWFHADNFCEMAVLVSGYQKGRSFNFGTL